MKVLTIVQGNETFQVKLEIDGTKMGVSIYILTVDQQKILRTENISLGEPQIAIDYKNEFTKNDAKKVVQRYLRYKNIDVPF